MGRIVTFYSYKGGVGRSFVLANVGALLAQWGYRVLCVDWDLEAPGLHQYFSPWIEGERPGVIDLIAAYSDRTPGNWVRHITRVPIAPIDSKLDLMTAGTQDDKYFTRAQAVNWNELYEVRGFGRYLESLRAKWKSIYDFVLVDSRTGISDLAGICTIHLPDLLVFLFTPNSQSLDGATKAATRMITSRNALPFDRERLLCLPIVSRFAMDKEYEMASSWMTRIEDSTTPFFSEWLGRDIAVSSLLQQIRVPEVSYWTFGERLPVVEDRRANSDPQAINYSILNIAGLIARNLSSVQQLLLSRDSFLASAAKDKSSDPYRSVPTGQGDLSVFLSASTVDQPRSGELAELLELHDVVVRSASRAGTGTNLREGFLRELKAARFLIVLISGEVTERQNAEIESFVSLTVRTSENVGIIPVVLSDEGLRHLPRLLMSLQVIDGRNATNEVIVEKCLAIIRLGQGVRRASSIQLV